MCVLAQAATAIYQGVPRPAIGSCMAARPVRSFITADRIKQPVIIVVGENFFKFTTTILSGQRRHLASYLSAPCSALLCSAPLRSLAINTQRLPATRPERIPTRSPQTSFLLPAQTILARKSLVTQYFSGRICHLSQFKMIEN